MEIPLKRLAEHVGGHVKGDGDTVIRGVAPFETAAVDEITFADGPKFIKRLHKVVDGGVQDDGFYHVWIKAEVFTKPLADSMAQFTRDERKGMIKNFGNPTFAVDIEVISDETERILQRCDVCETEIASRLTEFGYRLVDWRRMEEDLEQVIAL